MSALKETLGEDRVFLCKGNAIPLQVWTGPEGSSRLRPPDFKDNRNVKVVRLSVQRTGRLSPFPPQEVPWYSFLLKAESTPGP
jgi:hypothetical protein